MKLFHYISDLHLEKRLSVFPRFAPISATKHIPLFLAGDIGNSKKKNYIDFLSEVSERYSCVFMVAGNHEYSRATDPRVVEKRIQKIVEPFGNVTYLHRRCVEYEGTLIAGCTLWTPSTFSRGYVEDVYFIYESVRKAKVAGKKIVVMTHHLPTMELVGKEYLGGRYDPKNWASNSDHVISPSISAWICGHTHDTINRNIAGVRFLVNSREGEVAEHVLN